MAESSSDLHGRLRTNPIIEMQWYRQVNATSLSIGTQLIYTPSPSFVPQLWQQRQQQPFQGQQRSSGRGRSSRRRHHQGQQWRHQFQAAAASAIVSIFNKPLHSITTELVTKHQMFSKRREVRRSICSYNTKEAGSRRLQWHLGSHAASEIAAASASI